MFRVLIFGSLARELSCRDIEISVPEGSTVRDANEALAALHPHKAAFLRSARLALNHAFRPAETVLRPGDELAVIELVGGG